MRIENIPIYLNNNKKYFFFFFFFFFFVQIVLFDFDFFDNED